jgi:hypothetical protein
MTKDEMLAKEMFLGEDEFWRGAKMPIADVAWTPRSNDRKVVDTRVA